MPDVIFIAPIPTTLDAGEASTSEVQVAKVGKFRDPRYGAFAITQASFDQWIKNFELHSIAGGREGIPIDEDHAPEKRGETKAIGWIKKLVKKGDALMATVAWTPRGKQLVEDREYAYLSPTYGDKAIEGKAVGEMLVGVAATNRPYLQMPVVSLCEADVDARDDKGDLIVSVTTPEPGARTLQLTEDTRSDTPGRMPILDDIRAALQLDDGTDEAAVLDAIKQLEKPKTLDELAKDEGKLVIDPAAFKTLSDNATAGAAAAAELHEQKFTSAFDKACTEGRAVPAQKETLKTLYDVDADTTITLIEGFEKKVNVEAQGGNGKRGELPTQLGEPLERNETVEDEAVAIFQRAIALEAEGVDYADAIVRATEELAV